MSFPDPPGPRMAYDRDGTVALAIAAGRVFDIAPSVLAGINSETPGYYESGVGTNAFGTDDQFDFLLFFPQLRDLLGAWGIVNNGGAINTHIYYELYTSVDSTNGLDGTWTEFGSYNSDSGTGTNAAFQWGGTVVPDYRNKIVAFSVPAVKAFRLSLLAPSLGGGKAILENLHLYGNYTTGDVEDVLLPWDPVLNQPLKFLDFGDIQRTQTLIQSFRVKNASAVRTAHQVVLSTNVLYDSTPSLTTEFAFSTDSGTTWQTNPNIGDIAPGAISSVVQVRDQVPLAETLGPWALRIIGSASGGWS